MNEACAGNQELLAEIVDLLHHDASDGNLLDAPIVETVLAQDSLLQSGTLIGPYKIREQIGEGGFGQVYVAEQTQPIRRKVALKLIKPGMDSKEIVARFQAERQALALMDHSNIARVLDAGATPEGRLYFVMELVNGIAITEFCNQQKLNTHERLSLVIDTCHAVQHAHQKGIIHRDLKPSNILVTMRDDEPIVKVIDFGVAKALNHSLTEYSVYTAFGQMIGTPTYMSPEQAKFNEIDVDTRSDIYSLGVLLYELLTGVPPFDKETLNKAGFDEMRRIIREDEPPKPSARLSTLSVHDRSTVAVKNSVDSRKLSQSLKGELDWVVMKAMEKDRERRYESPVAFAEDLQRFLRHQPVKARPPSKLYQFRKYVQRNRGIATSASLLLVTLSILGSWIFLQSRWHLVKVESLVVQLQGEKEESDRATKLAQRESLRARKTSYRSEMKLAFQRFEENRWMETSEILAKQIPTSDEGDLRGIEWRYLDTKLKEDFRIIGTHPGGVEDLALFPDGKRVVSAGIDGSLKIWDLELGTLVQDFKLHHRPIHAVAVSPDGNWIAYGEEDYPYDSHVVILDADSGRELARLNKFEYTIRALDFSKDGQCLISAAFGDTLVTIWEFQENLTGTAYPLPNETSGSRHVHLADDGLTLVINDTKIRHIELWDTTSKKLAKSVSNPRMRGVSAYAYNSHRGLVAYVFHKSKGGVTTRSLIDLIDVETGRKLTEFESQAWEKITFTPDGQFLLIGSYSGWLEYWDIGSLQGDLARDLEKREVTRVRAINGTLRALCTIDSESVLVAGSDGVIACCRLKNSPAASHGNSGQVRMTSIAASPDSTMLAWFGSDNRVRLTDYMTGRLLDISDEIPGFARTLVFSPCGTLLAAQCDQKKLQYWEITEQLLKSLGTRNIGNESRANHVAIDRNNVFCFGEENDDCHLLSTLDASRIEKTLQESFADGVLLSPDGQKLVMSGGEIRIFDRDSLKLQHHITDGGNVFGMVISSGSDLLASGHRDGTVHLHDLLTGKKRHQFIGHNYAVRALAFSQDNSRLITGSGRGILRFWDVESGECYGQCREFTDFNHWIRQIIVGPDEQWLDITAGYKLPHRWTKRVPLMSSKIQRRRPGLLRSGPTTSVALSIKRLLLKIGT